MCHVAHADSPELLRRTVVEGPGGDGALSAFLTKRRAGYGDQDGNDGELAKSHSRPPSTHVATMKASGVASRREHKESGRCQCAHVTGSAAGICLIGKA